MAKETTQTHLGRLISIGKFNRLVYNNHLLRIEELHMAHAVIDINAASLQLLIVSEEGATLADETRDVALQQDLRQSTLLSPERMQQILDLLTEMVEIARLHNIPAGQIRTVATMELRRALNAQRFSDRIRDATGLYLHILTPEEEGRLFWQGGLKEIPLRSGSVGILNLGAGSCSAFLGEGDRILHHQQINMGSLRLTEEYFGHPIDRYSSRHTAELRGTIQRRADNIIWPVRPKALVVVGPSINALASMIEGLPKHNPSRLHGLVISRGMLRKWVDRLLESTAETRAALCPAYPDRVDTVLCTALIMEALCTASFRDSFTVSAGGIRIGVIMDAFLNTGH